VFRMVEARFPVTVVERMLPGAGMITDPAL
jgi:hypothetical protein